MRFPPPFADDEVFAQNVDEAPVYGRTDMVELGDEGVFEPVDDAFA